MQRFEEQRVLPYPPSFLFEMIADVGSYPDFLPWCTATRLYKKSADGFMADVVIGFKMFHESWTSEVALYPNERITARYIKGPMKELYNEWRFTPHAEGTLVDLLVEYEFKNPLMQKILGGFMAEFSEKMISAFEVRAKELYQGKSHV